MAVVAGRSGSVRISAATVAEVQSWSLDFGPELEETQAFGDSWKERTPNLRDWSGSFQAKLDTTDTNGQAALITAALNGTSVSLSLYTDSDTLFSGTAYINFQGQVEVGSIETATYAFTGTGALSYTP